MEGRAADMRQLVCDSSDLSSFDPRMQAVEAEIRGLLTDPEQRLKAAEASERTDYQGLIQMAAEQAKRLVAVHQRDCAILRCELERVTRDAQNHPAELHVSERGRAELARMKAQPLGVSGSDADSSNATALERARATAAHLPDGQNAKPDDELSETQERAFELIPVAPGAIRGDPLADKLDVTAVHLRKEIIPILKLRRGVVTTRKGYQRPAPPCAV